MTHALIIDDDRSNLGVLEELLAIEGISCTAVQDATKVEATISTMDALDIILLDLEMPDIDGYQLFEILSDNPRLAGIPIVACTVHTGEVQTARELGFHSFISKPLNVDTFGDQLAHILNGKAVWQAY